VRLGSAAFYLLFCAAALTFGTASGWVSQSSLLKELAAMKIFNRSPEEVFHGRESLTLLVLGCDEDRYYGGKQVIRKQARSDMMLIARLDFSNNRITGVSIPRDTLVQLPGYRERKINEYHAIGVDRGPERGKILAREAATAIVPVEIDRVVVLDYDAFQEMVNLVGGVEVYIPKRMRYKDVRGGIEMDFKPGRQLLNGYDAMCFVRYRKSDSDFERQKRQKDFLLAFKETIEGKPAILNKVADKALDVLGGEFTAEEVAALALFARKIGADNVKLGQIPVVDAPNYNLRVDQLQLPAVLEEFHMVPDTSGSLSYRR
jgi:polyisoprenyl-teichoic acid--peptidoglycan teichoic acid transferase